jgi:nitrate reductase delta subunit
MKPVLTYRALAALLEYPEADLVAALPEIEQALVEERILRGRDLAALRSLSRRLATTDLYTLQEDYVGTFDRGRSTSLNLFEHVHGESRDRGQAMVDLTARYAEHGFALAASQLPDYLPALLEYLSLRPAEEARELLEDMAGILEAIGTGLARRASPYLAILQSLLRLAGEGAAANRLADEEREPAKSAESEQDALDREWAEAQVTFLGNACPDATPRSSAQSSIIHFHRQAAHGA